MHVEIPVTSRIEAERLLKAGTMLWLNDWMYSSEDRKPAAVKMRRTRPNLHKKFAYTSHLLDHLRNMTGDKWNTITYQAEQHVSIDN